MQQQDVTTIVVEIVAASLDTAPADVVAKIASDGGICDSIVGIEVIIAIEERFGISVPDDALVDICSSIPSMIAFVKECLSR